MPSITQVLFKPNPKPGTQDTLEIEINFISDDLHKQFYLEIAYKHALADGSVSDHFVNMVPVVAASGSQIVKYSIRKIGKQTDHREQVKFIVRIFGLVGRSESTKYDIK